MSSALTRRESLSRTSSIGSTGIRGSMMSRGHRSVSSIDSIDSMELREKSITSTIGSFRAIGSSDNKMFSTGSISISSTSRRCSNIDETIDYTDEEEKQESPIKQETKEDSAPSAAAGLEKFAAIKEYTRLLVERAAQSSKTAEEELEKERRAHQETKMRLKKMEQEVKERRRELQYLQARQSSWIKLAAVALGVFLLRQLFVLALSRGEYVPMY